VKQNNWRIYAPLLLAAILPIVLFTCVIALVIGIHEQNALETDAAGKAREISDGIDRFMAAQIKAATVVAQVDSLRTGHLKEFYDFATRIKAAESSWMTVVVLDPQGHQVMNLARPYGASLPDVSDPQSFAAVLKAGAPVIGDLAEHGRVVGHAFVPLRIPVSNDGRIIYILTFVLDPSELSKLFELADAPSDWIGAIVDRKGRVLARSARAEDYVGKMATQDALDALKRETKGVYFGKTLDGFDTAFSFTTSTLTGWSVHYAIPESVYRAPLQRLLWVVVISGFLAAALASLLFGILSREAARQRRAEVAALQSQKLEALGQFTSGIAHDFNNLLMAIMGNLEMARRRLTGSTALKNIEGAYEAAERGAMLTAQLLAFARKKPVETKIASVNTLVHSTSDLIRSTLGPTIDCPQDLAPDIWMAALDAAQIEVALLNLAINARDAMPRGGVLKITTRNIAAPQTLVLTRGEMLGDCVMIEVQDTGTGMDEEVLARAMEPFFTTKAIGKGTGLGLSQIHGVVSQHGGALAIESAPGRGTTVRLFLPRAELTATTTPRDDRRSAPAMGIAGLSLLVVDDDRSVLASTVDMLQALGCIVAQAGNAEEALQSLAPDANVDAVLTDYAMPGQDGLTLAAEIRRRWPQLALILMTGYADKIAETADIDALLRKPFSLEILAEVLSGLRGVVPASQPATR